MGDKTRIDMGRKWTVRDGWKQVVGRNKGKIVQMKRTMWREVVLVNVYTESHYQGCLEEVLQTLPFCTLGKGKLRKTQENLLTQLFTNNATYTKKWLDKNEILCSNRDGISTEATVLVMSQNISRQGRIVVEGDKLYIKRLIYL